MKLSATEKLARDICWLGFNRPGPHAGCRTAATYWARTNKDVRAVHMKSARELIWMVRRIGIERLSAIVKEVEKQSTRLPEQKG